MENKTKIFKGFLNYGTQSGVLAQSLREKGLEAISVTYSDSYSRKTDKIITNSVSLWSKIFNRPIRLFQRIYWFFHYDVFHLYYGASLFPWHIDFYLYRLFNKKIICHYLGNDVQGYWKSVNKYKWSNMPGFMGHNDPNLYDKRIERRLIIENKFAHLQLVCSPAYSEFVINSHVLPLAICLEEFQYKRKELQKIPIIVHAPTDKLVKGTSYIVNAVSKLKNEGYVFEFRLVENVSHDELRRHYEDCDFFIDQLLGGWYGTAAIEAMAIGRPVICSIRKSYFEFIDYGDQIPIIHADPDNIYEVLKKFLNEQDKWQEIAKASREFVEQIHDKNKVTNKLIDYYKNIGVCVE